MPAPPPESDPAIVRQRGTIQLPSPVLTGSGSTGVISAPAGAPRSEKGNVRVRMSDVQELRLVLTVSDFEAAVALYRDALGLAELEDWSDGDAGSPARCASL